MVIKRVISPSLSLLSICFQPRSLLNHYLPLPPQPLPSPLSSTSTFPSLLNIYLPLPPQPLPSPTSSTTSFPPSLLNHYLPLPLPPQPLQVLAQHAGSVEHSVPPTPFPLCLSLFHVFPVYIYHIILFHRASISSLPRSLLFHSSYITLPTYY